MISRVSLIRVWVEKYEAGALDEDAQAADLLQEYEGKIAALERMVGRQALEIEFLKGTLKNAPRPRSVITSVIAGPAAILRNKASGPYFHDGSVGSLADAVRAIARLQLGVRQATKR
jgi:hypothetical protein